MKNLRATYEKKDLGRSFALAVGVMLGAQLLLNILFSPFCDDDGNLPDIAYWTLQAVYCVAIGGVSVLYAKVGKACFSDATTANQNPVLLHIVWGIAADICLIAIMYPLNNLWLSLLKSLTGYVYESSMPMQLVPMIFVACVLPAICEEFTFRGTVAQSFRNTQTVAGKIGALAVSGALFAAAHLNPAQTLHQFALGALLAWCMFRSGSLWTAVIVHFFNNIVVVILSFVITDETIVSYYPWLIVGGLICLALCVFGYISTTKSRWGVSSESDSDLRTVCEKADFESKALLCVAIVVCVVIWIAELIVKQ